MATLVDPMTLKLSRTEAYRLLHEGSLALARVERNGLRVDTALLARSLEDVSAQIAEKESLLEADQVFAVWKKRWGAKTKLGAPNQLEQVLFKDLGYTPKEYTAGSYYEDEGGKVRLKANARAKTDKHVLEGIDLPFVQEYLRYRALIKVKSTYLMGLQKELVGEYVHPFYHLAGGGVREDSGGAQSYRSSCSDPNGQNFPNRDAELGRLVRSLIIPRDGHRLVEFDFKQAEVVVAYCYHLDPNMRRDITDPSRDMHRDTAARLFMVPGGDVSKMSRYCAKNMFVFAQFYGSVYFQCAPALWDGMDRHRLALPDGTPVKQHLAAKGITALGACDEGKTRPVPGTFEHHVKQVEDYFWVERYPGYADWKKRWYRKYRKLGYFDYLTGFRVEGLLDKNQVLNYPVQGSAFHCLLWCLTKLDRWLRKHKMRSRIIAQIHDSMLLDVHPAEFEEVLAKARKIMTVDLPASWRWFQDVHINVEVEAAPVGGSWWDKKPVGEVA